VSATQKQQAEILKLPTGHGEGILVVDDEAPIREITKTALEAHNYKVLTASNGIEAIELYAQHKDEISGINRYDDVVHGWFNHHPHTAKNEPADQNYCRQRTGVK